MKASATSSACEEDRRMTRPLRAIAVGAIAALSAVWAFAVNAQTYPERPIRVIVPIAAGSVTDVIMRATASELAPRLGQPFVIENRGGASGIPGAQACAQAAPDGYTLCLVYHNTLSINPLLFNQLPYDPERDFTLITNLYLLVEALFVNSSLNVNTAAELKAYAQAHPSALNYGTLGPGSNPEMFLKWMNQNWNVNIVGVPYRGGGPALQALVAGEVNAVFSDAVIALPFARAGTLRMLAVSTAERAPLAPEVPTIAESGLAGFQSSTDVALLAPAATPAAIVERLHRAMVNALRTPQVREPLLAQGAILVGASPGEFASYLAGESAKWRDVIRARGIRLQ